ncbi:MAG TPA: type II toxin-antitoxin system RelE/ParE family toxin [Terracidiphilus sp.]|nr:type II toxin-antitoxin system RelE/ParE family toxin [Terracidiphilus sp.]
MKVRWTMPAANQLQSIFEYIAANNPTAAYRTVRRIREAILLTARMPYSGRIGRVEGTRELTVSGTSYLVAYKIVDNMIHVLAILHGAQEWPGSL